MSVLETILIYVVIPLAGYLLIMVLAGGRKPGGTRYRPGSEWTYPPVWWTAHPAALPSPPAETETASGGTARGGARGRW